MLNPPIACSYFTFILHDAQKFDKHVVTGRLKHGCASLATLREDIKIRKASTIQRIIEARITLILTDPI